MVHTGRRPESGWQGYVRTRRRNDNLLDTPGHSILSSSSVHLLPVRCVVQHQQRVVNMLTSLLAASLLVVGSAVPVTAATKPACKDFLIPVNVTVPFYDINISIDTNWDLVEYIFNSTRRDSQQVFHPVGSSHTETKTFTIGATFCTPGTRKSSAETVLLLTHGSMVDRRSVQFSSPSHNTRPYQPLTCV